MGDNQSLQKQFKQHYRPGNLYEETEDGELLVPYNYVAGLQSRPVEKTVLPRGPGHGRVKLRDAEL